MRTGAAAGHTGYFHEAAVYRSDREFLDIAVPFLRDGVAAGEPTLVALGGPHADLVRRATAGDREISYLTSDLYARPAAAIAEYRRILTRLAEQGAQQVRILGELASSAFGATWDWWARYESAINHAYAEFPLWSICAYGTPATPPAVLADVRRTHPRTAGPNGEHTSNDTYLDPATYLAEPRVVTADPLLRRTPVWTLVDPTPAAVRSAVRSVVPHGLTWAGAKLGGFMVAVSEGVTNAIRHGRGPVRVRLWISSHRLVLTVTDQGAGPEDPYAGLLPLPDADPGGLGLWLSHQLCDHVAMDRDATGYTLRLTAGDPDADR
ncbi:MAG: sensor histidine kinase [Hamadaea sp.]|uniref:anti-sigma factor RsbA family regulatory protein n=1 Tax=Hamadaea sp. TaxID=2024425 RepID=UPI00180609D2|nr:anti-sigma factor RsbA family regulatory protein [Hamadaea sp.]NUR70356.1 sensor histidine kinase [Hamadaea sp.]NUT20516.1 sensor histidine kinase [Hamadaea sp.]